MPSIYLLFLYYLLVSFTLFENLFKRIEIIWYSDNIFFNVLIWKHFDFYFIPIRNYTVMTRCYRSFFHLLFLLTDQWSVLPVLVLTASFAIYIYTFNSRKIPFTKHIIFCPFAGNLALFTIKCQAQFLHV